LSHCRTVALSRCRHRQVEATGDSPRGWSPWPGSATRGRARAGVRVLLGAAAVAEGIVCRACGERRSLRPGAGRRGVCHQSAASLIPFVEATVEPRQPASATDGAPTGRCLCTATPTARTPPRRAATSRTLAMPACSARQLAQALAARPPTRGSVSAEHLDAYWGVQAPLHPAPLAPPRAPLLPAP